MVRRYFPVFPFFHRERAGFRLDGDVPALAGLAQRPGLRIEHRRPLLALVYRIAMRSVLCDAPERGAAKYPVGMLPCAVGGDFQRVVRNAVFPLRMVHVGARDGRWGVLSGGAAAHYRDAQCDD
ncbi:hypothetical protein [Parapedobacter defluvii]|uniref:hypothetical protein n=1 Tax=Parapedobacter defluvii TaxID=2045106 RepID=UPI0016691EAF|nr:hypothetical protein [Parapedobacter defluvii]